MALSVLSLRPQVACSRVRPRRWKGSVSAQSDRLSTALRAVCWDPTGRIAVSVDLAQVCSVERTAKDC